MAECKKCGDYTKFEGGLCYKCYKGEKPTKVSEPKMDSADSKGLTDRDKNYRYNMIKG